ncbi:MAG: YraN family protein [Pseudomonadota bacterium]
MKRADASQTRRRREREGRLAERVAALWLVLKGYQILALRARTPVGEVDVIAKKGRLLAFVEVKARATLDDALQAVTPKAWARIAQAAAVWTARRSDLSDCDWRYDLIAARGVRPLAHIRDAWRPDADAW